ncbi:MAG: M20/M25/M40 family metallo-hydrolase [Candidatus Acidiferrales bacterium]
MSNQLRFSALVLSVFLVLGLGIVSTHSDTPPKPRINADQLHDHVVHLSSPKFKGRGSGTAELDRAADYIAGVLKKAGVEPAFGQSYFQPFTVTVGAGLGKQNEAITHTGGAAQSLKLNEDYVPLNFSDNGRERLALAFAGYGITAAEYQYDDYMHMDVMGKAVIVLRHEPQEENPHSAFAGTELTTHSQIVSKAINARNHGARAMILVNDPAPHPEDDDTLVKFGTLAGPDNAGILLIHASRVVVNRWLAPAGESLTGLQQAIDEKLTPQSHYLPDATLELQVDIERRTAETRNVAGIVRGSDPTLSAEAIVVGAHYDHLGLGERNSLAPSQAGKVHHGADDNASGTATLLELARTLASQRASLKRSIVFMAFSGEELGLLGSTHYTKQPAWPLERTAAMVNLDMVGRPRENKLYVGGVGTSPHFREIVEKANAGSFALSFTDSGYGSSDHQSFYVKDVPVIFFFSGLHADYHKPSDTADRIEPAAHARVTELALRTTEALAALEERPAFVRVQEPQRPVSGSGGSGYGAYFGSIPDMGEEVEGVRFADVREGSPAAQAGLKGGDILVEFAGKPIKNLYDFTYALRAHKPGQTVPVTVLRNGEKLTADVTLAQRK